MFQKECDQCDVNFPARRRIDCYCSAACRQEGSARKNRERAAKWQAANPIRYQMSSTECRRANPEQARIKVSEWHKTHPEKHREHRAVWREAHAEEIKVSKAKWNQNNPDKGVIYAQNRRARKAKNGGSFTEAEWQALKAHHHFRCLCCHKEEPRVKLTVDHVVPVTQGGSNDIRNIQPLCLKCNLSKGTQTIDYRPVSAT